MLTGGTVISEDIGMKLETADLSSLGSCKKITISKDDTVILDGAGGAAAVERSSELRFGVPGQRSRRASPGVPGRWGVAFAATRGGMGEPKRSL